MKGLAWPVALCFVITSGCFSSRTTLQKETEARDKAKPIGVIADYYFNVGTGHWISKVIEQGTYILLEDGSLWEIAVLDRIDTMLWLVVDNVTVVESSHTMFPYKLINTTQGKTAEAKYVGQQ
jgi:hypothetical protein